MASRITYARVSVLLAFCVVLASVSCGGESSPSPTPTVNVPATLVYIMPLVRDVSSGEQFKADIYVESERGISGGEIHIAYDPNALEVQDMQPGDLLGSNPLTGIRDIDNETGALHYALARVGPTTQPTPPGVLATISGRVLEEAAVGDYKMALNKVILIDRNFEEIKDILPEGASIKVIQD